MAIAAAYFFCILSAYYIIRPIRDQMGVAGGVRNLPWLWGGTLVAILIAHPPFAFLVARLSRLRFVSITYRFFMVNLFVFFVLLRVVPDDATVWLGRVFYVWTSVFNLFIVSVFWAFMTDIFTTSRSKRVFGLIGGGGTLGALIGAAITAFLVTRIGLPSLLLISIAFLEVGVRLVRGVARETGRLADVPDPAVVEARPIGGGALDGFKRLVRSPYLLGISGYVFLYTISGTVLYFQTAEIVERFVVGAEARTAFFAWIDVAVNALTLSTQLFFTGRIIRLLGVAATLTVLPLVCVLGFTTVGVVPAVATIVVFVVLRRATEFSVGKPARETLFTVVGRDERYKAKNLIDTFVYRTGDQIAAWSYRGLTVLGLTTSGIAFVVVPLAMIWAGLGLWLGRQAGKQPGGAGAPAAIPV
ncbi:MAG TPA: MFS transporter [Gemmatimonadales bacterium]